LTTRSPSRQIHRAAESFKYETFCAGEALCAAPAAASPGSPADEVPQNSGG
jgi:hypothetical protein